MEWTIAETRDPGILTDLNEEVQSLHHQWYPNLFKPFDRQEVMVFFSERLKGSDWFAYVASDRKGPLGYVLAIRNVYPDNPFRYRFERIILDQLVVIPAGRKLGLGRALVKKVEDLAIDLNIPRIELNHWTSNEAAHVFFQKVGFQYFNEQMTKDVEISNS